ncbi:exodeoxyribonuclease VII small subunit [Selenihalanaerobacter shriftii]|nr:exodeoxyribonuclease VII small subunit [Selenihalanaerobacter shriftii]
MSNKDELSFEDALEELEEIVDKLEVGELGLEESLTEFEEGIKLSKFCSQTLQEVEEKIEIIINNEVDGLEVKSYNLEEKGAE